MLTLLSFHCIRTAMELKRKIVVSVVCIYLSIIVNSASEQCDKTSCPGPLAYYADLGCTPVYRNGEDCCAYKYNCEHLNSRSTDKCYINGNEYNISQVLNEDDAMPCDIGCVCQESLGLAQFACAAVDCFDDLDHPGCYRRKIAADCCSSVEICPDKPEDRPTCEVDGKIYKDGEYFVPAAEPNKSCYCGPNYKGENIAPFCRVNKQNGCRAELHFAYEIHNKCAPTYYYTQSPKEDCSVAFRCQNNKDEVLTQHRSAGAEEDDMTCQFGNLIMRRGDELNQATYYSSVCMKCVCEVGPTPTCQRLSDKECDITKHPVFDTYS